MTKIIFDDHEYDVPEGLTILQASKYVGREIPIFCYHDRLSIAGNCRMCLVEVAGSPKPVASCALPITEGMVVKTKTEMTRKARKGVLEFLLINHPLDCPICDQGGECDLQDITMAYGPSSTRFQDNKRAVPDKSMGPLIKTSMTRCIHCTRCVRFAADVAGVPEMGAIGRGENTEITTYLDQVVSSELSGNVIDLCPVGALTSKPYAFQGRPWELQKTESIDVLDALGSHIRIDSYRMKVMRILPRLSEEINEEWLSDKARFSCDGLAYQRLDTPYIRDAQGVLQPATWQEAYGAIAASLKDRKPSELAGILGPLADAESSIVLKDVLTILGCKVFECRPEGLHLDNRHRGGYLFNSTIAGVDQADVCLIVGSCVRAEAPLLAARLRKWYLTGALKVAYIGAPLDKNHDLTHAYENLGDHPGVIKELVQGTHAFSKLLKEAKNPMIIVGEDAVSRADGAYLLRQLSKLVETYRLIRADWNGYNFLAKSTGMITGLEVGFASPSIESAMALIYQGVSKEKITWVYNYGVDTLDFSRLKKAFMVYQGHHGDVGAAYADIIIPGCAYTEKDATYVNCEGRAQRAYRAVFPPGKAQEDWSILLELAAYLKISLPYTSLAGIRDRLAQINTSFRQINIPMPAILGDLGEEGPLSDKVFSTSSHSFYQTDVISGHSPTMAKCAQRQAKQGENV